MKIKRFHMRTDTDKHYISTQWLDVLGFYETMVFKRRKDGTTDWSGIKTLRTEHQRIAAWHHYKEARDAK